MFKSVKKTKPIIEPVEQGEPIFESIEAEPVKEVDLLLTNKVDDYIKDIAGMTYEFLDDLREFATQRGTKNRRKVRKSALSLKKRIDEMRKNEIMPDYKLYK